MNNVTAKILHQLGGNKFVAMTGAKFFSSGADYLQFSIPYKIVKITLDPSDTYSLNVWSNRTGKMLAAREGVYADNLKTVFTSETGMYTSL